MIRPPFKKFSKGVAFFPLQIGDNVFIGEGSIVNAAVVSSYVYIGKNVIIVSNSDFSLYKIDFIFWFFFRAGGVF